MAQQRELADCLSQIDRSVAFRNGLMNEGEKQVPYAGPLLDAVGLFESLGIGYALIGGVAAMVYGRARFTEDVDFIAASGHMDFLIAKTIGSSTLTPMSSLMPMPKNSSSTKNI